MSKTLSFAAIGAWVSGWAVIAGVAVSAATAEEPTPTPTPLVVEGAGVANLNGVEARVVSVTASPSQTLVQITFEGREAEGSTIRLLSRSTLQTAEGTVLRELGGRADGRTITLTFPTLPAEASSLVLDLGAVALATEGSVDAVDPIRIGGFLLGVPETAIAGVDARQFAVQGEAALGPGTVTVTEVIVEPDATVIRGRLTGFTREQIQEISLGRATLTAEGSEPVTLLSGRGGDGEGLRDFELRFPPTGEATGLSLEVPLHISGVDIDIPVHNPGAGEALRPFAGSTATIALSLAD